MLHVKHVAMKTNSARGMVHFVSCTNKRTSCPSSDVLRLVGHLGCSHEQLSLYLTPSTSTLNAPGCADALVAVHKNRLILDRSSPIE